MHGQVRVIGNPSVLPQGITWVETKEQAGCFIWHSPRLPPPQAAEQDKTNVAQHHQPFGFDLQFQDQTICY